MSFLSKKIENASLLINISNGGVSVSITSFFPNQKPNILYYSYAPLIGVRPEISALSKGMTNLVELSLRNAVKNGFSGFSASNKGLRISRIAVSFTSPWFLLKTKDIHLSQDVPYIISKSFIEDVVQKEEELFKKELVRNYFDTTKGKFEVLERSIVHTKVNGYYIENTIGQKTKSFDASLFMSVIAKDVRDNILNIILKHIHISKEDVLMHSLPLVLFSTLRDTLKTEQSFMIINIDSEITDLILVEDNIIRSVASFPFGKNTIVRHISKLLKVSLEIAESQFSLYLSNKIDGPTFESIKKILGSLEKEWIIYLEDALLNVSPKMTWPQKTIIVADDDIDGLFNNFLMEQTTEIITLFKKNMQITKIDQNTFSDLYRTNLKMKINESMIALIIFYNKLGKRE